jgi:hypothetical protein
LDRTYDGNCQIWQIVSENDPKTLIYDVWLVDIGTALVFHTGTTKNAGLSLVCVFGRITLYSTRAVVVLSILTVKSSLVTLSRGCAVLFASGYSIVVSTWVW